MEHLVKGSDLNSNEIKLEKYMGLENERDNTQNKSIDEQDKNIKKDSINKNHNILHKENNLANKQNTEVDKNTNSINLKFKSNDFSVNKNNKSLDIKSNISLTEIQQFQQTNKNSLISWNPNEVGGRRIGAIEVYTKELKELQKGDIIKHTKNDKQLNLINSRTAEITKIGLLNIHMRDRETNKSYKIPKDHHSLKHLDYGYATTVHSAQGKTSDNIIAVIESYRKNLTNQKTFYVEVSRAKEDITLIVDNKEKVINQLDMISGEKASGLEVKRDSEIEKTNTIKKTTDFINDKVSTFLNKNYKDLSFSK